MDNSLSNQQVTIMVRAVSLLMYVTRNLMNSRDQLAEILHGLLTIFISLNEKDQLTMELNEEVLDVVVQCGEDKDVKILLLEGLARQLLAVIGNINMVDWIRKSWVKTLNFLLSGSNYKLRESLGKELSQDLEQIVDFLYTCGDYDTQSSLVETLLRFTSKADRSHSAPIWFPNYALVQSLFIRIKDFENDCRIFLNCFNKGLGTNQLVHTFPALTCRVGDQQMFKPSDQKYSQFWVDINLGPGSVGIYHVKENSSSDLWDLVTITHQMVTSAVSSCQAGTTVLTLSLCQSPISPLPAGEAVIVFTPDSKLSQTLLQLFPKLTDTTPPPAPAVKPAKCSRAGGQLLLQKISGGPKAIPAVMPTLVLLSVADLSSSSQASLPCGQTGSRMSTAEMPVLMDSKARQAANKAVSVKLAVRKQPVGDEDVNNVVPDTSKRDIAIEKADESKIEKGQKVKKLTEKAYNKVEDEARVNGSE